jgi:hypothetical protein
MFYTAFSIEIPTEEAATNVVATVAHMFAGCQCPEDCPCNEPDGQCEECRFDTQNQGFACTTAACVGRFYIHSVYTRPGQMLHLDVYSEEQFTYAGLRALVDILRGFATGGHLMMTHLHRDFLTGERASGKTAG